MGEVLGREAYTFCTTNITSQLQYLQLEVSIPVSAVCLVYTAYAFVDVSEAIDLGNVCKLIPDYTA
jgi:hypothetical protein